MDLAQTLVRSVVRSFYDTRHILVIDAIVIYSAIRDDDLAYLLNMNTKDLRRLCGELREDRFLAEGVRPELKEGHQRPVNRTYYYIDYRQTIDAIKWRVYKIDKEMQGVEVPVNERKEYFCNRLGCMKEYTQMDVLDTVSERGFLCRVCGSVLRHDPEGKTGGHKQSTRMNDQFKFITGLLPKIDSVVIPDNTFDVAVRSARPVERDAKNRVAPSVAVEPTHGRAAVKGLTNTGPKTVEINITSDDGPSEADREAERLRKENLAKQNALPSWIAESTITGEKFELDPSNRAAEAAAAAAAAAATDSKKDAVDAKDHAEIDDYFAKLRREQEAEEARKAAAKAEEEEEWDEDEEEDEFEDVVATTTSNSTTNATGTPAGSKPATPALAVRLGSSQPVAPSPLRQSSLKRDASSGPGSASNSPLGSDGRPVKKVKLEEPTAGTSGIAPSAPAMITLEDGESDEDDVEFEDV